MEPGAPWRFHVELLGRGNNSKESAQVEFTAEEAQRARVGFEFLDRIKQALQFAPHGKRQAPHGLVLLAGFPTPEAIEIDSEEGRSRTLEEVGIIDGDTVYVRFGRPPAVVGEGASSSSRSGSSPGGSRAGKKSSGSPQEKNDDDDDDGASKPIRFRMRVLWLHGFGSTGETYHTTNKKLVRSLRNMGVECVFPDGPIALPDETYDWTGSAGPYRDLGRAERLPAFWSETVPLLLKLHRDRGPFAGVVGFSGGGTAAHQLAAMRCELLLHERMADDVGVDAAADADELMRRGGQELFVPSREADADEQQKEPGRPTRAAPPPPSFALDYHPSDFDPTLPAESIALLREFLHSLRFFVLVAATAAGTEPAFSQSLRWRDPLKMTQAERESFGGGGETLGTADVIAVETEQALWLREAVAATNSSSCKGDPDPVESEVGKLVETEIQQRTALPAATANQATTSETPSPMFVDPVARKRQIRAKAFATLRDQHDTETCRLRDAQIEHQLKKMRRRVLRTADAEPAPGTDAEPIPGTDAGTSTSSYMIDACGRLDVPSLHVSGQADQQVSPSACEDLAWRFRAPVLLKHDGHHVSPTKGAATRVIKAFLRACMEGVLGECPEEVGGGGSRKCGVEAGAE